MVFGSKKVAQRLSASLKAMGIELLGLTEVPMMAPLLEQNKFDLALVDSLAEKAELACHHISEYGDIPLVLVVNKKQKNWGRLDSLDADGYVNYEARGVELAARLKAVVRRSTSANGLRKQPGVISKETGIGSRY